MEKVRKINASERAMYLEMVKDIMTRGSLEARMSLTHAVESAFQRSQQLIKLRESTKKIEKDALKWRERQARKEARQGKKD